MSQPWSLDLISLAIGILLGIAIGIAVRQAVGTELAAAVEIDLVAAFDELDGCDSEAYDGAPLEQLFDEIRG